MAEQGFRVVAPDLRGFCAGARPEGVEANHIDQYAQDALGIADALGHAGRPFHLMGTSIGSSIAWWLAGKHADRVATLVCINIPHPGALGEGRSKTASSNDGQDKKFNYLREAAEEGNERAMFEGMLAKQGASLDESEPHANWVTGPYRLEIVKDVHQPALQAAPERMTPLLLQHLAEHGATVLAWRTFDEAVLGRDVGLFVGHASVG